MCCKTCLQVATFWLFLGLRIERRESAFATTFAEASAVKKATADEGRDDVKCKM